MAEREIARASCVSKSGNLLAYREKNLIIVKDLISKKVLSSISVVNKDNNSKLFARPLAFINEDKNVVVELGNVYTVFDVTTEVAKLEREYSSNGLNRYFSNDDAYEVVTFADSFKIIDNKTRRELKTIASGQGGRPEEIKNAVFSPESRFIVILSDNKVRFWDLQTFQLAHSFTIGLKDNIFCFTTDGRYLLGGSDSLKIWEVKNRRELKTPIGAEGKIMAASISRDGRFLASGDSKGFIRTWEMSDENLSALYFAREIDNETRLIPAKKEFEKSDEYNKRRQKLIRTITNKYLTQYLEKIGSEKTMQESWAEEDEAREENRRQKIAASRVTLTFRIDSIGTYNADRETFTIKIVNDAERISRTETLKVQLKDNAQCFKQKYQNHTVSGIRQLSDDLSGFEIFNVKIKSNCSGK
ncbi:MAG: hypothetical protein HC817_13140, partial [Saprospiraceae bacterium]|nr:hypothetical protein [Saprospiraceae bacterium]